MKNFNFTWKHSVFFITYTLSILLCLSSSSYWGIWMSMEINLLSIMPIMFMKNNLIESESAMKYFLIQGFSSVMYLFSNLILCMNMSMFLYSFMFLMVFLSVLFKMGAAPAHLWNPSINSGLTWFMNYIMLVLQKIIPLYIFMMFDFTESMYFLCAILSMMIGAVGGLTQFCLRKLLAFSSINHMGWLLSLMYFNWSIALLYYLFYAIIMIEIIFTFSKLSLNYLSDISVKSTSSLFMFMFFSNFFSLAGLPPFMGFFPKILSLEIFSEENLFILSLLFMLFSIFMMYFYTRLTLTTLVLSSGKLKTIKMFHFQNKSSLFLIMIIKSFMFISVLFSCLLFSF